VSTKFIYELYIDTFKYSYKGYWSSVEKALEELDDCAAFRRAMLWRRPQDIYDTLRSLVSDNNHNESLPFQFQKIDDYTIQIVKSNFKWVTTTYKEVPEIKVEGQPYKAPSKEIVNQTEEFIKQHFGYIEITRIPLDKVFTNQEI
jgi:hypothetical protein